jgi:hypothetical protein
MRTNALRIAQSLVAVMLAASSSLAFGGTLNLSTGLNASGGLLTTCGAADAHWTVTFQGVTAPAQVDVAGCNFGNWVANGPNSAWISHTVAGDDGPAPYFFSTTFSLADTTGASLSGAWGIDDGGFISLNGIQLDANSGPGASSALTAVSTNSGFVAGLNTLSITINLADRVIEGVRFEGSVTGNIGGPSSVPEPGSVSLVMTGAALGLARLLKRTYAIRSHLPSN